jgi:hypothetical protein
MLNKRSFVIKEAIIKKLPNGKYRLYSHKGKNLGTFDTHEGAEKHEREVNYFKNAGVFTEKEEQKFYDKNYKMDEGEIGYTRTFPSNSSDMLVERHPGIFKYLDDKATSPYTGTTVDLNSQPLEGGSDNIDEKITKLRQQKNMREVYPNKILNDRKFLNVDGKNTNKQSNLDEICQYCGKKYGVTECDRVGETHGICEDCFPFAMDFKNYKFDKEKKEFVKVSSTLILNKRVYIVSNNNKIADQDQYTDIRNKIRDLRYDYYKIKNDLAGNSHLPPEDKELFRYELETVKLDNITNLNYLIGIRDNYADRLEKITSKLFYTSEEIPIEFKTLEELYHFADSSNINYLVNEDNTKISLISKAINGNFKATIAEYELSSDTKTYMRKNWNPRSLRANLNNRKFIKQATNDRYFRYDTGYVHDRGATAYDVVVFEKDMGNEDVLESATPYIEQLKKQPATDIQWFAKDNKSPRNYMSEGEEGSVSEFRIPEGSIVIATDPDNGVLILKPVGTVWEYVDDLTKQTNKVINKRSFISKILGNIRKFITKKAYNTAKDNDYETISGYKVNKKLLDEYLAIVKKMVATKDKTLLEAYDRQRALLHRDLGYIMLKDNGLEDVGYNYDEMRGTITEYTEDVFDFNQDKAMSFLYGSSKKVFNINDKVLFTEDILCKLQNTINKILIKSGTIGVVMDKRGK